ncbi:ribosome silencing factor [Hutsoniella sourekii]|uniref:ribosome silencing factor n=1 Tax=Hutsoniella sourekii TaxID=87650 RepID=UPI000480C56D|nr:ribosome silencing factor [Hutsoniella sourekii]
MREEILKQVEIIVKAADDRLGQHIMVLDVTQVTPIADYFIIMDAKNDRQLQAVVTAVKDAADEHDIPVKHIEGKDSGRWILVDLGDIIVHVFHYEERAHYNLENIWADAPLVDISDWIQEA